MNPWNMLEIIHEDERDGFGMRGGDELESAYRKGCEHGYRKAMEEMRGGMGFREGGYGGGSTTPLIRIWTRWANAGEETIAEGICN